jgi:molecular chaperone DnaJ
MQLKVSNKGNDAPGNSVPGDLIVAIEELEHEFLKREKTCIMIYILVFLKQF